MTVEGGRSELRPASDCRRRQSLQLQLRRGRERIGQSGKAGKPDTLPAGCQGRKRQSLASKKIEIILIHVFVYGVPLLTLTTSPGSCKIRFLAAAAMSIGLSMLLLASSCTSGLSPLRAFLTSSVLVILGLEYPPAQYNHYSS